MQLSTASGAPCSNGPTFGFPRTGAGPATRSVGSDNGPGVHSPCRFFLGRRR